MNVRYRKKIDAITYTNEEILSYMKKQQTELSTKEKQMAFLNEYICYLMAGLKTTIDLDLGYAIENIDLIKKVIDIRDNL